MNKLINLTGKDISLSTNGVVIPATEPVAQATRHLVSPLNEGEDLPLFRYKWTITGLPKYTAPKDNDPTLVWYIVNPDVFEATVGSGRNDVITPVGVLDQSDPIWIVPGFIQH